MQDILTCAMGLDIHRDIIAACLAKGELGTDPEIEIRSFSTLIPEMRKLRDWVLEAECHNVAKVKSYYIAAGQSTRYPSCADFSEYPGVDTIISFLCCPHNLGLFS